MARSKAAKQLVVGTVHALDLPPRGDRAKAVSLRIRRHVDNRVSEEWMAVAKPLKARVRELAQVPEALVGQTFEFTVDEAGRVTALRRLSA